MLIVHKARRYLGAQIARQRKRVFVHDEEQFDVSCAVETRGYLEPADLTIAQGDAHQGFTYVGTSPRLAGWWFAALPRGLDGFTFIDLGSGKGRVLFMAANRGFRRVIGVEFSFELYQMAQANVERFHERTAGPAIELVLGDAGQFEFPLEPLVVYFNNPFSERVMERVLGNLAASYVHLPRPIVAVYQQMRTEEPGHRTRNIDLLAATPFLARRPLPRRGLSDRILLAPYRVEVFASPEVREGRGQTDGERYRSSPGSELARS